MVSGVERLDVVLTLRVWQENSWAPIERPAATITGALLNIMYTKLCG